MTNNHPLEGIVLTDVVVDGVKASSLDPQHNNERNHLTSEDIAREAGICPDSPKYSGLHDHCQYSRTC